MSKILGERVVCASYVSESLTIVSSLFDAVATRGGLCWDVALRCSCVALEWHRRFVYKGDTSTHARGTDARVALGA